MSALIRLRAAGARLWLDDGRLRFRAPADLAVEIHEHREEILAELATEPWWPAWREALPPHDPELRELSLPELLARVQQETEAMSPEPEEPAPAAEHDAGPWPKFEALVRLDVPPRPLDAQAEPRARRAAKAKRRNEPPQPAEIRPQTGEIRAEPPGSSEIPDAAALLAEARALGAEGGAP